MRAVLLLIAICAAGCNAVFGLDERAFDETFGSDSAPATDAEGEVDGSIVDDEGVDSDPDSSSADSSPTDTSLSSDTATPPDAPTPPDTSPPPDTPPPDTTPVDTGVPCPIFGLKCAAGEACIVSRSSTGAYSYACETPPPGATAGASCYLDAGRHKCAAGLACNDRFPSGTVCVPLCASITSCTSTMGYGLCPPATWTTSPVPMVNVCDYCDPMLDTTCAGGSGAGDRCGIGSQSTPPSCRKDFGGRDPGQSCNPGYCRAGSVCDCGTELGPEGCGTKPGVCVKLCRTTSDCGLTTGMTCLPLRTGYPISGCR